MEQHIAKIAEAFGIEPLRSAPVGNGWINDTFRITATSGENYILQRINNQVFKDVDLLQHNIFTVTEHLKSKYRERGCTDVSRMTLSIVRTAEGKLYHEENGEYWRMYDFIGNAETPERVDEKSSYLAGKAFGRFQADLADLKEEIRESIPDFHNMEFRLEEFRKAVAEDAAGRAESVRDLIAEAESAAERMTLAQRLHREGKLPKRICHCDTKVNNMMFDSSTGEFLCVIDLDTVMPGFIFSDTGDFLRSAANTGAEDDPNPDHVGFDMDIFRAFIRGYLESAEDFLTETEKDLIPYGTALFPYMQFVRFLTDYLNGDTYYKVRYREHNLVRSRAQLKLFHSVEAHYGEMEKFLKEIRRTASVGR